METAHRLLMAFQIALLIGTLFLTGHILSWYMTVGLPEVTLLVSFAATSYGRMNVRDGHLGIVIFALLLAMFVLVRRKRDRAAGVLLGLTSIKPTFFVLYALYFLTRRRVRLLAAMVVTGITITILPLALTARPVAETLRDWTNVLQERNISENDPSPFFYGSSSLLHLEPLVYRVLNAQSRGAALASSLACAVLTGWAPVLVWRSQPTPRSDLIDFGLISALTLLAVYHRPYDLFLLIPGVLAFHVHASAQADRAARWRWHLLTAAVVAAMMVPSDLTHRIYRRNPAIHDVYLWRVLAPFQTWAALATLGALLWLKVQASGLRKGMDCFLGRPVVQ